MSNEQLYLVLGCFGRKDDGFVSCPGVENRILKIDEALVYYNEVCDYMESVRLFDKPMFDTNAIRHFLYNMQDRYDQKLKRLWSEKQYQLYERFMVSHKICGLYVRLIVVQPSVKKVSPAEQKIFVPSTAGSLGDKKALYKRFHNK